MGSFHFIVLPPSTHSFHLWSQNDWDSTMHNMYFSQWKGIKRKRGKCPLSIQMFPRICTHIFLVYATGQNLVTWPNLDVNAPGKLKFIYADCQKPSYICSSLLSKKGNNRFWSKTICLCHSVVNSLTIINIAAFCA